MSQQTHLLRSKHRQCYLISIHCWLCFSAWDLIQEHWQRYWHAIPTINVNHQAYSNITFCTKLKHFFHLVSCKVRYNHKMHRFSQDLMPNDSYRSRQKKNLYNYIFFFNALFHLKSFVCLEVDTHHPKMASDVVCVLTSPYGRRLHLPCHTML